MIITIEMGRRVVCDDCDAEMTDSPAVGGILFQSKALCPTCAPKWEARAVQHGETRFIRGRCPEGKSFADWVRQDVRQPKAGR
jgi:hypothetical protein